MRGRVAGRQFKGALGDARLRVEEEKAEVEVELDRCLTKTDVKVVGCILLYCRDVGVTVQGLPS